MHASDHQLAYAENWACTSQQQIVLEAPNCCLKIKCILARVNVQVYLEGELERGIVPLESAWMHDHGEGEDGCLLLLQKMNLELLQRHAPLPPPLACCDMM